MSDRRTLSFAGLATAVHGARARSLAMGIERGDRVAIWAPNVWEWVVAALGLHSAGAVLVPLNTPVQGSRSPAYILGKSRAKALVTITGFLDTDYVSLLREAVDVDTEAPRLEAIAVLRGGAPEGTRSWAEFMAAGSAVDSALVDARAQAVEPGRPVRHPLHLGYDREPQGGMLTHAQTLRAYRDWSEVVGLQEHDRYLIVNPFFHAFGYKAGMAGVADDGSDRASSVRARSGAGLRTHPRVTGSRSLPVRRLCIRRSSTIRPAGTTTSRACACR